MRDVRFVKDAAGSARHGACEATPSWAPTALNVCVGVLTALASAVLMATAVSAQPRASAYLHPVEGGQWEAWSLLSPSTIRERICLNESAYVLAARVEPSYGARWMLFPETGSVAVAGSVIGEDDGRRWSWMSFTVEGDQCFDVGAAVTEVPAEGRRSPAAFRLQLYELRVDVDW